MCAGMIDMMSAAAGAAAGIPEHSAAIHPVKIEASPPNQVGTNTQMSFSDMCMPGILSKRW